MFIWTISASVPDLPRNRSSGDALLRQAATSLRISGAEMAPHPGGGLHGADHRRDQEVHPNHWRGAKKWRGEKMIETFCWIYASNSVTRFYNKKVANFFQKGQTKSNVGYYIRSVALKVPNICATFARKLIPKTFKKFLTFSYPKYFYLNWGNLKVFLA